MAAPKSTKNGQSKIKSANPIFLQNGSQEVYNGQNGALYGYNLILENGDAGKVNGSKPDNYTYPAGTEITYTLKTYDSKNGDFHMFANVKKVDNNFQGGGGSFKSKSTYNNPETVAKMSFSVASECVIKYMEAIAGDIPDYETFLKYAMAFYGFITSKGLDRDLCSNRWHALQHAIGLCLYPWVFANQDNKTKALLELAEKLFAHVDSIKVSNTN